MLVIEKSGEFGSIYIVLSCFRYFTSQLSEQSRQKGYSDISVDTNNQHRPTSIISLRPACQSGAAGVETFRKIEILNELFLLLPD